LRIGYSDLAKLAVAKFHDERDILRSSPSAPSAITPRSCRCRRPRMVKNSVPLAEVLSALPDPDVHRRSLDRYQEAIDG